MGRILFRKLSRRSHRLRMLGMHVEGTLLHLFWLLAQTLSPEHASATGRALIRWLGPKTHKHHHMTGNLRMAFPDMNDAQRDKLACEIWGNFGAVMGEYPHLDTLSTGSPSRFVDVVMNNEARVIFEDKQPAIYVTAHLGNWELVGSTIARSGIPLSVIYGPQSNPVLERMLQQRRESLGCRLISKKDSIRQLVRELRSGRSVGLLPDQRVDSGEPIPFFGQDAPTTTSPAWLALKLNCPLVPVQVERTGNARFRTIFHRPILVGGKTDKQSDPVQITADLNRMFERWIRRQPEQWLCMKRRWLTDTGSVVSGRDPNGD